MTYDEITPYLDKIVRINLNGKKRKIGWLVVDHYHEISEDPLKEVHCVNVRFAKKHFQKKIPPSIKDLKDQAVVIPIENILKIHSCI